MGVVKRKMVAAVAAAAVLIFMMNVVVQLISGAKLVVEIAQISDALFYVHILAAFLQQPAFFS